MRRILTASWLLATAACSIGNIHADACTSDLDCAAAFGIGSTCDAGFCSEPAACATGHDCRENFGGGACVAGVCSLSLPADPLGACTTYEPASLPSLALFGPGAPLLVGAMFRLSDPADAAIAKCALLAAREINQNGALQQGRPMGMVVCDDSGQTDEDRKTRVEALVDYLGGTLGVAVMVGPSTSADSVAAITRMTAQELPSVMISPSATSPELTGTNSRLGPSKPPLFWRTAPSDTIQAQVLVGDVVGVLGVGMMQPPVKRVSVVYIQDPYGTGLEGAFSVGWGAKEMMGDLTSLLPFTGGKGEDWNKDAATVAAQNPDAVLFIALDASDTVAFIGAALKQGFLAKLPLYTTDGSQDASTLLAASVPQNVRDYITSDVFGTAPASPSTSDPAFQTFAAALNKDFGVNPANFSFTANGYDAGYLGAMGLVFASAGKNGATSAFDGNGVAQGLGLLNAPGVAVGVGPTGWPQAKTALTTHMPLLVHGLSGPFDFAIGAIGEPKTGPIQIWQAKGDAQSCKDPACGGGNPPCICTVKLIP